MDYCLCLYPGVVDFIKRLNRCKMYCTGEQFLVVAIKEIQLRFLNWQLTS